MRITDLKNPDILAAIASIAGQLSGIVIEEGLQQTRAANPKAPVGDGIPDELLDRICPESVMAAGRHFLIAILSVALKARGPRALASRHEALYYAAKLGDNTLLDAIKISRPEGKVLDWQFDRWCAALCSCSVSEADLQYAETALQDQHPDRMHRRKKDGGIRRQGVDDPVGDAFNGLVKRVAAAKRASAKPAACPLGHGLPCRDADCYGL